MEILGTNEIGYKEPIQVDNNGHLIISGSSGGGSSSGSAIIPPTTTTGNISGVGAFGKTNGANTYSPLNIDATGHLLVSSSGDENVVLIQGNDGVQNRNVLVEGTGQISTQLYGDDGGTSRKAIVSTEGRLEVQIVGSSDINGGAPHRHLTIDGTGRILTIPQMTATNNAIAAAQTRKIQGYDTANTTYRDVAIDTDGHLQVDVLSGAGAGGESYTQTTYLSSITLASQGTTSTIDLGAVSCKELRVFFTASSEFVNFYAVGSNDDSSYYALFPTNGNPTDLMYAFSTDSDNHPTTNGTYTGSYKAYVQYVFAHPPRYVLFRNAGAAAITGLSAHYFVVSG